MNDVLQVATSLHESPRSPDRGLFFFLTTCQMLKALNLRIEGFSDMAENFAQ